MNSRKQKDPTKWTKGRGRYPGSTNSPIIQHLPWAKNFLVWFEIPRKILMLWNSGWLTSFFKRKTLCN